MTFLSHAPTHVRPTRHRRSVLHWLFQARGLHQQRAKLRDLAPHLLDDIGITAAEARQEAAKPFWDAPENWTK